MGLSSPDSSGGDITAVGNGPAAQNHNTPGNTLMHLISQRFPISSAIGGAAGIPGLSPSSQPAQAPAVPGQAPLPQRDIGTGAAAPVDPEMLKAGQVGSQHSDFVKSLMKALVGGL